MPDIRQFENESVGRAACMAANPLRVDPEVQRQADAVLQTVGVKRETGADGPKNQTEATSATHRESGSGATALPGGTSASPSALVSSSIPDLDDVIAGHKKLVKALTTPAEPDYDPAAAHDAQELEAEREDAGETINPKGKTMLLDEMNGHLAEAVAAIRDKFPNSTWHDVSFEVSDRKAPQCTISFTAPDVEWCIASGSTLDEAISRTIKRGLEKMDQVKRNMSEAAVLMARVADLERQVADFQRLNAARSGQLKA